MEKNHQILELRVHFAISNWPTKFEPYSYLEPYHKSQEIGQNFVLSRVLLSLCACVCVCEYVCICICVCVCEYVYVCVYVFESHVL